MEVVVLSELWDKRVGGGKRELTKPLIVVIDGVIYVIPIGFVTDYSTIPWYARWIVRWSAVDVAGVIHDWLLQQLKEGNTKLDRKQIDDVWRIVAQQGEGGANALQAWVSWLGIRSNSISKERKNEQGDNL